MSARPAGVEPTIPWFVAALSIWLFVFYIQEVRLQLLYYK